MFWALGVGRWVFGVGCAAGPPRGPTLEGALGRPLAACFAPPWPANLLAAAPHLAAATGMSVGLIEGVLGDAVRIDDEIAACLGDFLGTDARFWTGLQSRVDRGLLSA